MIAGIGLDLIEIERVQRNLTNEAFLNKVFSVREQEMLRTRGMNAQTAAGNWAAKEAIAKALGCGLAAMGMHRVEVLRDERGRPYACFYEGAKAIFEGRGRCRMHITITNLTELAAAMAVWELEE